MPILKKLHPRKVTCLVCTTKCTISDCTIQGIIFKGEAGYPSIHDGDLVEGFICDSCISEAYKSNKLKWISNYFSFPKHKKKDL